MILGVIPARSGSKTIKDKNLYPLCGIPLIEYTIRAAYLSKHLDDIIISTDYSDLLSESYLTNYRIRPKELCTDDTPMINVLQDALECYETVSKTIIDAICLLQPTSPIRFPSEIDNAILKFKNASSLYSGYYLGIKHKNKPYDKNVQLPHFQRNGSIFITKSSLIRENKIWDDDVIEFEMPKERSIDIDDMSDMFIAESLIKNGILKGV